MVFLFGILAALGSGLGSAFSGRLDPSRGEDLVNNDLFKQMEQIRQDAVLEQMDKKLRRMFPPTKPVLAEALKFVERECMCDVCMLAKTPDRDKVQGLRCQFTGEVIIQTPPRVDLNPRRKIVFDDE